MNASSAMQPIDVVRLLCHQSGRLGDLSVIRCDEDILLLKVLNQRWLREQWFSKNHYSLVIMKYIRRMDCVCIRKDLHSPLHQGSKC